MAQNIADDELLARPLCGLDNLLRIPSTIGKRLLHENMRPRLHCLYREIGMGVGQRIDRDDIGFELAQSCLVIVELDGRAQHFRQFALLDPAFAYACDFQSRNSRIGKRVAHAHVAEPHRQYSQCHPHAPLP